MAKKHTLYNILVCNQNKRTSAYTTQYCIREILKEQQQILINEQAN